MTTILRVNVQDIQKFKDAFKNSEELRRQLGISSSTMYQSQTNPSEIFIISESAAETNDGDTTAKMQEIFMNAGVNEWPDLWFLNKIVDN